MENDKKLGLYITSPYGEVVEKRVQSILFTTLEGEISIRAKHENGVYQIKPGPFFIREEEDAEEYCSLGGMALVEENKVRLISPLITLAKTFEKEREEHLQRLGQRYSEDLKSEADLQRVQMALRNSLIQKK